MVLYTASYDLMKEHERLQILLSGGSDGLLMLAPLGSEEEIALLERTATPVVVVHVQPLSPLIPSVSAEYSVGAGQAMQHLLELGHRRIAFICGLDPRSHEPRWQAYLAALEGAGLPFVPEWVARGDNSQPRARQLVETMLELPNPPTAVFAYNDFTAFGAMDAARVKGLRLPEDFSVVGVDDIPSASQVYPALTTVHHPLSRMGESAAEMVLDLLSGKPLLALHRTMQGQLIVRNSTAPFLALNPYPIHLSLERPRPNPARSRGSESLPRRFFASPFQKSTYETPAQVLDSRPHPQFTGLRRSN